MPVLGENLRFVEPEPLTDEILAQHAEIDVALNGLYVRVVELAPPAKERHWYSTNGVSTRGPKVTYTPPDNTNLEMTAWFENVHWLKGHGPSFKDVDSSEVEVILWTRAKAVGGAMYGKKGPAQKRLSAASGNLLIWKNDFFSVNLKGIPYESATNILTDIDETLDLMAENNAQ